MDILGSLFGSDGFMPHGYCYLWNSGLVWLHVVSDALIFLSYMAISITLVYFVRRRRDLPFGWMFISFGAFIVACGFTHGMEVWTLWHADYWIAGGVKAVTALASLSTAVLLIRLVPNALAISSPGLIQAEAENRRLATAVEQVAEAVLITDTAGIIQYVNPAFTWMTGFTSEEALNQTPRLLKSGVQGSEVYHDLWKTIKAGKTWQGEILNRRKDGSLYLEWMTISPVLDSAGQAVNFIAIKQDISERKRAEDALRKSEEKNRFLADLLESSAQPFALGYPDGRIEPMNAAFERLMGYTRDEMKALDWAQDLTPPEWLKAEQASLEELRRTGRPVRYEKEYIRKDGSRVPVELLVHLRCNDEGKPAFYYAFATDLTERKKAEQELVKLNRVYAVISQINQLIVRTQDEKSLFAQACQIAVEHGRFLMAWIGMVDEKDGKFKPVVWKGAVEGYLPAINRITVENVPEGQGPTGTAVREGRTISSNDIAHDPGTAPWRDEALKCGYRSSIALPIVLNGKTTGALSIYAAEPFFFNEGEKILLQEVAGDISFALEVMEKEKQRKLAEDAEQKMAALVENSIDFIGMATAQGKVFYVNEAGRKLMGMENMEEVTATSVSDYLAEPSRLIFREKVIPAIKEKGSWSGEGQFRHFKTGKLIDMECTALSVRHPKTHKHLCFAAIVRDITKRKKDQEALLNLSERLNLSMESAHMGTWDWIVEEDCVVWGDRIHALFGLKPGEFHGTIKKFLDLIHPDDREDMHKQMSATIEKGGAFENEFRIVWRDGSVHTLASRGAMHFTKDGRPDRMSGITWDVTERKELEQQLLQSQKMEAVGHLAGGVAHDFNNLLTVINGYSEVMLQKLKADSPYHKYVEEIKKAGDRAAALTRQLLAFSRQQVMAPQVLDLNQAIGNIHTILNRLIGEDIDLVTIPGQSLGHVKADPGQIEQVLLNLAVNSRDAMPQGGKLTIETSNVDLDAAYAREHMTVKAGSYVMLAVSDSGTGMDAETQKRIFDPFFTTKEKGKGTGLGLSTVYGIVKQSGGYIWVYSEVGHGTTFKIYLPRVDTPLKVAEISRTGAGLASGTETILLAEDDGPIRTLVRATLENRGFTILEAPQGADALLLAAQHQGTIHLLLTDLVMPEISGRTLAERLAVLHPETRVLYMSGYTDDAVIRHGGLEAGTAFLQKPFTPQALARKVREVLDSNQSK